MSSEPNDQATPDEEHPGWTGPGLARKVKAGGTPRLEPFEGMREALLGILDDWERTRRSEQAKARAAYTRKADRGPITPKMQQRAVEQMLAEGEAAGKYSGTAIEGFVDGAALDRLRAAGRARREWENRYAPWKAEIIYNAHHLAGVSVPDIAEEFGCSEGYVYRVLRTNTAYEYRLDVRDGAPGPGWQSFEAADVVAPINTPEVIAHRAIEEYLAAHPEHADHEAAEPRLRVLIWTAAAEEQPDEQAVRTVLWPYPDDDDQ
jgi:AraC-like DNA-binding protein